MYRYSESYQRFARIVSEHVGTPLAFIGAISMIIFWLIFGPLFHFSDTYQLIINTVTTILTFLMVFVIQNTQNHDTEVIQLKLDELIRVTQGKHILLSVEELSEESIERLKEYYSKLADEAREQINDMAIVDLSE